MSEVPLSQEWADERDAEERVCQLLREIARDHCLKLDVTEPRSWRAIADHLTDLREVILHKLKTSLFSEDVVDVGIPDLGLVVRVQRAVCEQDQYVWISDPDGSIGADLRAKEQQLVQSFYERIQRKVLRDGSPRRQPSIRPCSLVLYPNYGFPSDLDLKSVIDQVRSRIDFDISTHFDEIWVSTEEFVGQVL
jgi:hypothetical protein